MLDPETGVFWFIAAGTLGVIGKIAWGISDKLGGKLTMSDMMPMPPPHPPLPRFVFTKPELLGELKGK